MSQGGDKQYFQLCSTGPAVSLPDSPAFHTRGAFQWDVQPCLLGESRWQVCGLWLSLKKALWTSSLCPSMWEWGWLLWLVLKGWLQRLKQLKNLPKNRKLWAASNRLTTLEEQVFKKVNCILISIRIFPCGTEIVSVLIPIVSASLGHMMGEVSAVSQGSRSLRDDRPQVSFLLWFIQASQFSVMEIHLNQRPFAEPFGFHAGHL